MNNLQPPQNNLFQDRIEKGIEKLLDFEKSEILQTVNHTIKSGNEFMDKLDKKYQIEPISVEQYLRQISPNIDEQITKHIHQSKLQPLGGEIKLSKDTTSDNILVAWDFYFNDQNNKMHKIGSHKIIDKIFFTQESYERITQNIVFDINPPKY